MDGCVGLFALGASTIAIPSTPPPIENENGLTKTLPLGQSIRLASRPGENMHDASVFSIDAAIIC